MSQVPDICHDADQDVHEQELLGKGVVHQCPEEHLQVACAGRVEPQVLHDVPEQVEEHVFHDDRQNHGFHIVPEMSVQGEITAEDMMHKLRVH